METDARTNSSIAIKNNPSNNNNSPISPNNNDSPILPNNNDSLSPQQWNQAINEVQGETTQLPLRIKGKKRQLDEVSPSDSKDIQHIDKKLKSNDDLSHNDNSEVPCINRTQNWVENNSSPAEVPEEPNIPHSYIQEPVGVCDNSYESIYVLKNKIQSLLNRAYKAIDDQNSITESLLLFTRRVKLRVREQMTSSMGKNVSYDDHYDSDTEFGNEFIDLGDNATNTGIIDRPLKSLTFDSSSVPSHIEPAGSSLAGSPPELVADTTVLPNPGLVNNSELVSQPAVNTDHYFLFNPELADNPELTVHHCATSQDDVLTVAASDTTVGMFPLNDGQLPQDVTYNVTANRIDQYVHSNYLIHMQGKDTMDYRVAFEYLKDTLDNLHIMIVNYNYIEELTTILNKMGIILKDLDSGCIESEAIKLLELLSSIN